ncbi:DnaJ domain-containing protein [Aquimarina sp. RZ0]|uniref:DnaJ domain-containing protein n=1 Tax=Aquimarina sp. RZ0 TaxID=2607730 RepID=UPI0011F3808D|nr:DnaJ domain-containing protein [Aquimarina sp. RZ0]KAA1243039.1 DnaJ domain-containing protein [Aquimarina sp. RZ0]
MKNKIDYYKLIGIGSDFESNKISSAIRKLSLKYHPDRQNQKTEKQKEISSKIMIIINGAKDVLLDEENKKQYEKLFEEITGKKAGLGLSFDNDNLSKNSAELVKEYRDDLEKNLESYEVLDLEEKPNIYQEEYRNNQRDWDTYNQNYNQRREEEYSSGYDSEPSRSSKGSYDSRSGSSEGYSSGYDSKQSNENQGFNNSSGKNDSFQEDYYQGLEKYFEAQITKDPSFEEEKTNFDLLVKKLGKLTGYEDKPSFIENGLDSNLNKISDEIKKRKEKFNKIKKEASGLKKELKKIIFLKDEIKKGGQEIIRQSQKAKDKNRLIKELEHHIDILSRIIVKDKTLTKNLRQKINSLKSEELKINKLLTNKEAYLGKKREKRKETIAELKGNIGKIAENVKNTSLRKIAEVSANVADRAANPSLMNKINNFATSQLGQQDNQNSKSKKKRSNTRR